MTKKQKQKIINMLKNGGSICYYYLTGGVTVSLFKMKEYITYTDMRELENEGLIVKKEKITQIRDCEKRVVYKSPSPKKNNSCEVKTGAKQ